MAMLQLVAIAPITAWMALSVYRVEQDYRETKRRCEAIRRSLCAGKERDRP